MEKIECSLTEFNNYIINNYDRCYYVNNDMFYAYEHKTISGEFIVYKMYFMCKSPFESGQVRRPILLSFLKVLLRRQKINKILKR